MRRGLHTKYETLDTQIYEYKGSYFVLEMCQQGEVLNPAHGPSQRASEFCGLSAKLEGESDSNKIGQAVLTALDEFDTKPHPFSHFDIPLRNKTVSGWFGARGMASLEKNCRVVQVLHYLQRDEIHIIPFDNHNRNNWNGPMDDKIIVLPSTAGATEIGDAVRAAFAVATYHPERKDPVKTV
ncbi:hypothetical protein [Xanthomonas euvesicatoria]|uniref:hypothetical protein n=1 Tax=Xanthomonas euvesicatoria TaxID=456327 RepID=UPI00321C15CB